MVKVKENMTGWKMWEHGVPDSRLTVLRQAEDYIEPKSGQHQAQWLCECNCEDRNIVKATGNAIRRGNTKSCGCLRDEKCSNVGKNMKKYNTYKLNLKDANGLYGVGYCSNTGSEFYFDMEDYDKIKDYTWNEHILTNGYHALESWHHKTKKIIRMHYLLVGKNYDHADRNPLNNRRYNLRNATTTENAQNRTKQKSNTSGIVGVEWRKDHNKWYANISVNKNRIWLGSFGNKDDAIRARLNAEAKYFGEYAPQKYLFEQYKINGDVEYLNIERKTRINNTSGVTGVSYDKKRNLWVASIIINGKYNFLGRFKDITYAIISRLSKEKECFGDKAPQYYLFEQYGI